METWDIEEEQGTVYEAGSGVIETQSSAIEAAGRKLYMETWDIEGEQGTVHEDGSGVIEAHSGVIEVAWCWCD